MSNHDQGPVPWRPTTVKWRQFSKSNCHSTIGTRLTEYHEELSSSANVRSHLTSSFADYGNASWYSLCRVPTVEWRLDCEICRHLTVVGLRDTGPCSKVYLHETEHADGHRLLGFRDLCLTGRGLEWLILFLCEYSEDKEAAKMSWTSVESCLKWSRWKSARFSQSLRVSVAFSWKGIIQVFGTFASTVHWP